jgi:NTE family protein
MISTVRPSPLLRTLVLTLVLFAGPSTTDANEGQPGIGLALGSGGAGGLAHIAMLEVLEELSIRPDAISGSSIGAVVGALYAAGLDSQGIRELFKEFGESAMNPFSGLWNDDDGLGWTDLLGLDLDNDGLISTDGFLELVGSYIEARDFADLEIPLKIVATDYWSGEPVVITEGDLFRAIKASMAVPGLFAPVKDDDRLLIDGGVSNPLPWDLLEEQDLVIAIDVTGIRAPSPDGPPDLTKLLFKTFEIMQQSIIRQKLATAPPDIYIKPELDDVRLLYFDRVDEVISQASAAADELRRKLEEAKQE